MNIPDKMTAMVLEKKGEKLKEKKVPVPSINPEQVLIKIKACGVCHTDLHIIDQELTKPKLPLIPGHEIVGKVVKVGDKVKNFNLNDRVGVPWLGYTCGHCRYCKRGEENLCENALFTGYTIDGGYAE
ncbi:MAG: alcohol dehydrogenase catalytic domain-containing protein, partial [Ignavibacteriaceae bacterium]